MTIDKHLYRVPSAGMAMLEGGVSEGFPWLTDGGDADDSWGEYAVIRQFFLNNALSDEQLYGFFPSHFRGRTLLGDEDIDAFVDGNPGFNAYVFPGPVLESTCYLNVFEQGEAAHPGFMDIVREYVAQIGLNIDPEAVVMKPDSMVYSTNLVAHLSFWRTWFDLAEKVYQIASAGEGELAAQLNTLSQNRDEPVYMKTVLIDRLAALVLMLDPELKIAAYPLQHLPACNVMYADQMGEFQLLDSQKFAYGMTKADNYLHDFRQLSGAILQRLKPYSHEKNRHITYHESMEEQGIAYMCLTHVPLSVSFPSYVTPVFMGEAQHDGALNLRDLAPEWEEHHPVLGGLAGTFAVKNYLQKHRPDIRKVGICQYRKFVSRSSISGQAVQSYVGFEALYKSAADQRNLAAMMWPGTEDFLFSKPFTVHPLGYMYQYGAAHHVEDILRFTSEAVELGLMNNDDVMAFILKQEFVAGGVELGIFPADFWVKVITDVERIVQSCISKYPYKREGYQSRIWAFCTERYTSYMLCRHLDQTYGPGQWQDRCGGVVNIMMDDDVTDYIPGK